MKKYLSLIFLVLLSFTLIGCDESSTSDSEPATEKVLPSEATTENTAVSTTEKKRETIKLTDKMKDKKTLADLEVENGKKGVVITWGKYKGAEKYKVCRKINSGTYEVLKTKKSDQERKYIDEEVKSDNGVEYKYAVVAYKKKNGERKILSFNKKTIVRLKRSNIKSLKQVNSTSFKVNWYENDICDGYEIKYRKSNSENIKVVNVDGCTTTSKIMNDLSPGKYHVYIRCYYLDGDKKYTSKWTDGDENSVITLKEEVSTTPTRSSSSSSNAGPNYYWTDSGGKYHSTNSCRSLKNTPNYKIHCGNPPGNRDACKICVR